MASSILSPRSKASLNASEMDAKLRETAAAEGLLEKMQHGLASAKSPALGAGGANKGPWTKEEDEMLIQLVNECGTKQWSVVASHLKVRRAAPLPAQLQPGSLLLLARTGHLNRPGRRAEGDRRSGAEGDGRSGVRSRPRRVRRVPGWGQVAHPRPVRPPVRVRAVQRAACAGPLPCMPHCRDDDDAGVQVRRPLASLHVLKCNGTVTCEHVEFAWGPGLI